MLARNQGALVKSDPQRTKEAWLRFVESGELPDGSPREEIHRAWKRCQRYGVNPRAMEAHRLSPKETAARIERNRDLIEAGGPYMLALSLAAGEERHAAMLSDESGVVLDIVADEETAYRTEGFPTPGSVLSEDIAGANGIGSALAENSYVELVGPEHFIEGFHVYTCQGLPMRGTDGSVVGALSTSVRRIQAHERLREILICAAHGIEAELTRRRLEREVSEVLRRSGAEGTQLEALRQDVTQIQAAARLRLEQAARVTRESPRGALELVFAADQLLHRFRRHSDLWREIAFEEIGLPQPVDLHARLTELADLMATEAAMRRLRIRVESAPRLHVLADSRELTRLLFRSFLRAFEASEPGQEVEVRSESSANDGQARISFTPSDGVPLELPIVVDAQQEAG